jgi:hypothetical protein
MRGAVEDTTEIRHREPDRQQQQRQADGPDDAVAQPVSVTLGRVVELFGAFGSRHRNGTSLARSTTIYENRAPR